MKVFVEHAEAPFDGRRLTLSVRFAKGIIKLWPGQWHRRRVPAPSLLRSLLPRLRDLPFFTFRKWENCIGSRFGGIPRKACPRPHHLPRRFHG